MEATEVRKLAALEDRHWWYAERRWLLRRMVRRSGVLADSPRRPVAVDVGAAGGGNTRELARLGCFAVPVEYGEAGAAVARERGLEVVRGDATALPFAAGAADLVVAFDVIEHIDDDVAALREMRRVLRPGGVLLLAVPTGMDLWSAHDEAVGHVRRYDAAGLLSVVRSAGFTVTEAQSWMVLLRPVVRLRRSRSTGSDLSALPTVVNAGLRSVVVAERVLPLGGRRGVSMLVTARA